MEEENYHLYENYPDYNYFDEVEDDGESTAEFYLTRASSVALIAFEKRFSKKTNIRFIKCGGYPGGFEVYDFLNEI